MRRQTITASEQAAVKRLYLNPAFKVDDAEHDEVIANARAVRDRLIDERS